MGQLEKLESQMERMDWVPQRHGLRFVVVNRETGEVVNDANGYGYKTEAKCWSFIRMMQKQVGIEADQEMVSRVERQQSRVVFVPEETILEICRKIEANPRIIEPTPLAVEEIKKYGITLKVL